MKTRKIRRICWCGAECIGLACRDLAADFARTGTPQPEVEQALCIQAGSVSVGTVEDAAFVQAARPYFAQLPAAREEYALCVLADRILVAGTDKRGAMWGVYRISRMLGVPEAVRFLEGEPSPGADLRWLLFGARYMARLSRWAPGCCRWAADKSPEHLAAAAGQLERCLEERKAFAAGRFENWYRSDEKVNAPELLSITRQAAAR